MKNYLSPHHWAWKSETRQAERTSTSSAQALSAAIRYGRDVGWRDTTREKRKAERKVHEVSSKITKFLWRDTAKGKATSGTRRARRFAVVAVFTGRDTAKEKRNVASAAIRSGRVVFWA